MSKFLVFLFSCGFVLFFGLPVLASSDSHDVTATVDPVKIAMTVDTVSFEYGAVALGGSKEHPSAVTVTNAGNVQELFWIQGDIATDGQTEWALLSSDEGDPGHNTYVHEYKVEGPEEWLRMNPSSETNFAPSIVPNNSKRLWFRISLPTSSDTLETFETTIHLVATET